MGGGLIPGVMMPGRIFDLGLDLVSKWFQNEFYEIQKEPKFISENLILANLPGALAPNLPFSTAPPMAPLTPNMQFSTMPPIQLSPAPPNIPPPITFQVDALFTLQFTRKA